jgi:hypothetical protein
VRQNNYTDPIANLFPSSYSHDDGDSKGEIVTNDVMLYTSPLACLSNYSYIFRCLTKTSFAYIYFNFFHFFYFTTLCVFFFLLLFAIFQEHLFYSCCNTHCKRKTQIFYTKKPRMPTFFIKAACCVCIK